MTSVLPRQMGVVCQDAKISTHSDTNPLLIGPKETFLKKKKHHHDGQTIRDSIVIK
jgi:hypothetical protein